jgi:hypothetical protein
MPEAVSIYTTKVSGLWSSRHEFFLTTPTGQELQGTLTLQRGPLGAVRSGTYRPVKGAVFVFERDPGMVRGQFMMWSETREWIGSTIRFHMLRRLIDINTGGKPFKLAPRAGFGRGWSLYAPKSGEVARILVPFIGRSARIEVYRKTPFTLLLLAYFLNAQGYCESLWPGPSPEQMAAQSA